MLAAGLYAMPQDSIGTKLVNGKTYIMHKVSKGEGVYGIARKYGVTAAEIYAANTGSEKSIQIGQVLLIPSNLTASSGNKPAVNTPTSVSEKVYHTVSKGQTLSSIAKSYNISVDKLKTLNGLKSDNIQLGQKLVVGEKTVAVKTPVANTKPNTTEQNHSQTAGNSNQNTDNNQNNASATEAPKNVVVNNPVVEEPVAESPGVVNASYNTDDGDEISESGLAVISTEGDLGQERSFILHPSAKIGTIVMITNPANNNTVFARVVGNCKTENGCILKMSKTVAAKLGANANTEVKVSYAK
jgi:LysM repeat protein